MTKTDESFLNIILAILAIVLIVPAIIWQSFVGNVLWGWFVTPATGLVAPGMAVVFGLLLFARLAFMKSTRPPEDDKPVWERLTFSMTVSVIGPAFALFTGWVAVQFV